MRRSRHQRGSAVTELALISVVMVPAFLYAFYFFDVLHIRLKVQEAARYGAWEFVGYNLHDYEGSGASPSHQAKFDKAKNAIKADLEERYANLISIDTEDASKSHKLAVDWDLTDVTIEGGAAPTVSGSPAAEYDKQNPGADLGRVFDAFNDVMGNILGATNFNPNGKVTSEVTINATATIFPDHYFEDHWGMGDPLLPRDLQSLDYTESVTLIADSWKLHMGEDFVTGKAETNTRYMNQASNVAYFGLGSVSEEAMDAMDQLSSLGFGSFEINMLVLRSKNYKGAESSGMHEFILHNEIDGGDNKFHTSPMETGNSTSEYQKTFNKRGGYYMGCKQAEAEDCAW